MGTPEEFFPVAVIVQSPGPRLVFVYVCSLTSAMEKVSPCGPEPLISQATTLRFRLLEIVLELMSAPRRRCSAPPLGNQNNLPQEVRIEIVMRIRGMSLYDLGILIKGNPPRDIIT
jgi:hypothetical protein